VSAEFLIERSIIRLVYEGKCESNGKNPSPFSFELFSLQMMSFRAIGLACFAMSKGNSHSDQMGEMVFEEI